MHKFINKIFISLVVISLIFIYVLKRRFFKFKFLIESNLNLKKITNYPSNDLVRYSMYWIKFFKINSCFTRSLVIRDILIMGGYAPIIQIGISKVNKKFKSHCWVKLDNFYTEEPKVRKRFKLIESSK